MSDTGGQWEYNDKVYPLFINFKEALWSVGSPFTAANVTASEKGLRSLDLICYIMF
jgi:hypothetical protein